MKRPVADGGLPNAPLVVTKRGRRYLSLPLGGGAFRLLLPILREDRNYWTVYNPLASRGVFPLLKVPKHKPSNLQLSVALAAFQK